MAIANYKVTKEFEYDGVKQSLGQEIVLSDREGDRYIKDGSVILGRFLDPEDEKDQKAIATAEAKYEEKYETNMAKEAARDEAKEEGLEEEDGERAELIEEAHDLMTAIAEADGRTPDDDEMRQVERIETAQIRATVEKLRAEKAKLDGEEVVDEEKKDDSRPAVSDKMKREDLEAIAREEGISDAEIEDSKTKGDLVNSIESHRA